MKIVHMIGNAHLDPVWLWPWQAGTDEALATFRSAADRCDEYPEFIYTRGESWLYEQVEKFDPKLFARIRKLIRRGQWHVTGGHYIQPDCNAPTEIGWRRQLLHGQRYFQKTFRIQPNVGYNVDSFGHPATLPDFLAEANYTGYVLQRPSPQDFKLPGKTFRWRGPKGGEIIAFRMYPCYTTRSDDLHGQILLALEHADPNLDHTMCFYGVGNHGGGPTKANIEFILENRHAFEGAELRFSTPQAYFEAVARDKKRIPVYEGDIQHVFPGCYSVMHDIKQNQHHGERLLEQAERAIELFSSSNAQKKDGNARLDTAWDDLLFTQFHDILAGTSSPSTWSSVRAMQGRAQIAGEEIIYEATRRWAREELPAVNHQQIAVANTSDAAWDDWMEHEPFLDFDSWGDRWISDLKGNPVPFQRIQPDGNICFLHRILFRPKADAGAAAHYLVRDDAPPKRTRTATTDLRVTSTTLENKQVALRLSPGGISQLRFGQQGTNLLGAGGIGLHLRNDASDTWSFFHTQFTEPVAEKFRPGKWNIGERGPLRASVWAEGTVGGSTVKLTLSLCQGDPRVFLRLDVNFNERYRILQLCANLPTEPRDWLDGIPGGNIRRKPAQTEWPVQGWSSVKAGNAHLAMITADAYSISHDKRRWQWSLLRSPKMAWGRGQPLDAYAGRDDHTDQGCHTFQFILWPAKRHAPEALDRQAKNLLQKPVIFDRYEGMNRPPWGNSPPRHLWTENEQRALEAGHQEHLRPKINDTPNLEELR